MTSGADASSAGVGTAWADGLGRRQRPLAIVTGGTRRVGREIALAFAKAGCDLLLTARDPDAAASLETRRAAESLGARCPVASLELRDLPAVARFGEHVATVAARADVLVHNASVYDPTPLSGLTGDAILEQYTVNAAAPLLLTQRLAGRLAESTLPGGGAVIAMLDIHAMGRPRRRFSAYLMSKAALAEMVRALARELAPRVRVNGVAPGVVAWPEKGDEALPAAQAAYLARVPLGRAGHPGDAAEAARWLALDAHYCTGEVVRVDGGRWLG